MIDPYLWLITEHDRDALDIGRKLQRQFCTRGLGKRLEYTARIVVRRKQHEWRRLDDRMWSEFGYLDLGGGD